MAVLITMVFSHSLTAQNETIDISIEELDQIMHRPMTLESISSETVTIGQSGIKQKTKRWRYRLGPIGGGTLALMHLTIEVTYQIENKRFTGVVAHSSLLSGGGFGIYFNAGNFAWNIGNDGKLLTWNSSGVLGFSLFFSGGPVGWSRTEYFSGEVHLDDFGDFDGDGGDSELINVNRT
ncbi:hypothetical protein BFP97_09760 [Roseivirga sp. 4D4]|nr:hypothetical protein BFP97_09760 [Roseivirga sp. 4D4]